MGKYIPVEPEKWAEMVKAQAEVNLLKAEVEGLVDDLRIASEVRIKIADKNARLKAEVERLRKAGDAVALEYHTLCRDIYCDGWLRPFKSLSEFKVKQVEDWNAAKDGKPSA
jgi:hypothetical protein